MMDAVELAAAQNFRRMAPANAAKPVPRNLSVKWTAHQVAGVGIGNVRSVSKLSLPAHPPRVFTVSGTDQFGNPVTEEI
jgi:hypothetical protein